MSHAEKCPVCAGAGHIREVNRECTVPYFDRPCHGCSGAGWVTVHEPIQYRTPLTTGENDTIVPLPNTSTVVLQAGEPYRIGGNEVYGSWTQ